MLLARVEKKDSMLWLNESNAGSAVSLGGSVTVSSASRNAKSEFM